MASWTPSYAQRQSRAQLAYNADPSWLPPSSPSSAQPTLLERVLDRFPYGDGAGRRRILAGVLVSLSAWSSVRGDLSALTDGAFLGGVLDHPLPALAVATLVYLAGTLVELLGDVSLVRGAAGAVAAATTWPSSVPWFGRLIRSTAMVFSVFVLANELFGINIWGGRLLLALVLTVVADTGLPLVAPSLSRALGPLDRLVWWPFHVTAATIAGLFGKTDYRLRLTRRLSPQAVHRLSLLPPKISEGLDAPVGNYGELAIHYVIHSLGNTNDRRWAYRRFNRARDVSTVISAIIISLLLLATSMLLTRFEQSLIARSQSYRVSDDIARINAKSVDDAATDVLKVVSDLRQPEALESVAAAISRLVDGRGDKWGVRVPESSPLLEWIIGIDLGLRYIAEDFLDGHRMVRDQLKAAVARKPELLMAVEPSLSAWQKAIDEFDAELAKIDTARRAVIAERAANVVRLALLGIAMQSVLALYLIFFVSLRSSVESAVELLAIEGLNDIDVLSLGQS